VPAHQALTKSLARDFVGQRQVLGVNRQALGTGRTRNGRFSWHVGFSKEYFTPRPE